MRRKAGRQAASRELGAASGRGCYAVQAIGMGERRLFGSGATHWALAGPCSDSIP